VRFSSWLFVLFTAVPVFSYADIPVATVRRLLSGDAVSIGDTLGIADAFRTGKGEGVWQDDCMAKYFYKLAIDSAQTIPGLIDTPILIQAANNLTILSASYELCDVRFTGAQSPTVPLNYLVVINGQTPRITPNPDNGESAVQPYALVERGALPRPVSPTAIPGMLVPEGRMNTPPQLPPPVQTTMPLELVMAPQESLTQTSATGTRTGARSRASVTDTAPIILETKGLACTANWTQYGILQEFMRDYARMAFFVYAGPAPIARAVSNVEDLDARFSRATPNVKVMLKYQRATAVAESNELQLRRERKRELANAGYVVRTDLHDAFFKQAKLNDEKLEKEDFEFEIYDRHGYFVVVFRGTSLKSGWLSDARQILNMDVGRGLYEYADLLVRYLIRTVGIDRRHISTTGHSLGGGLAVYSHMRNDTDFAMAFNPAELSAANHTRAYNPAAAKRVFNYISYVPGTEAADFVSQGSFVAKEMQKMPLLELPDGHVYGEKYYIPIHVGGSDWKLATMGAVAGGAIGAAPLGVVEGLAAAARGAALAPEEKINTAKANAVKVTGAKVVMRVILHPRRTVLGGGIGAVAGYIKVAPMENLAWGVFQMHIMKPLEAATSSKYIDPQSVVCAGPPTPQFVKQQVDITSRVGNFLKLAEKVASAQNDP
jgi:hypothetical protein